MPGYIVRIWESSSSVWENGCDTTAACRERPARSRSLAVGAKWMAEYEWWAHARIGRREGVSDETIDAIRHGRRPPLSDPLEIAVYEFTAALLESGRVEPAAYDVARAQIGDAGLVELVTLAGYYTLVSFTLNAFEVPLPAGERYTFGNV